MATLKDLREAIAHVFSAMVPTIQSAKERVWDPSKDGFLPIVQRAILIRQYECFDTILHLDKNSRGYAAVVLLRPAVEELIWCKYLDTIDKSIANKLLLVMSQLEANDSLKAQDDYLGRTATKKLGLLIYLDRLGRLNPRMREDLKEIGLLLKWEQRTIQTRTLPSLEFMARRTDLKREYNFLYHATSRFSHFSVVELLRRAWGGRDKVSITSENYSTYWSSFALYWGFWLLTRTYLILQPHLTRDGVADDDVDDHSIIQAFERIAEFGYVPIITADELKTGFQKKT